MKKIIDGRMYNTDTAKSFGSWENTPDVSDFHWEKETLYRKKNGEFFLHCCGGPLSSYGQHYEMWESGECITPLTVEQAKNWSEENLDVDTYQELFGKASEGDDLVKVTIQLEPKDWEKMNQAAEDEGTSVSDLVKQAVVKEYLK